MARKKVGLESKVSVNIAQVQRALRHMEWEIQVIRKAISKIDTSAPMTPVIMDTKSWDGETDPIILDRCKARK